MSEFTESDVAARALCPHGDQRRFCAACAALLPCGHPPTASGVCGIPWCGQGDDVPEALIQEECVRFMSEDGWRHLRTDPVSNRSQGRGFGEPGMSDSQFSRPALSETARAEGWCQLLYVEFKCGRNKAQKHQIEWATKERARGFLVWIANETFPATVEGFKEFYAEKSGLMRRPRWW